MTNMAEDQMSFDPAPDPEGNKPKNLWQKLSEIQRTIGYIERRGRHPTKHFSFLQIADIRKELGELLAMYHVNFIPECIGAKQQDVEKESKHGTRFLTRTEASAIFKFSNGDNPTEEIICRWIGWAEGDDIYSSAGGMTHAQRHFFEAFFMLVTGDVTKKQWDVDDEAKLAIQRARGSERALGALPKTKIVGGPVLPPTKEELEDIDPRREPDPEPPDESWRVWPLVMCPGLDKAYPGKTVSDIKLAHLIQANNAFVVNVINHKEGYSAPGHHQLANAMISRMGWEIEQGNIKQTTGSDKIPKYEILKKP